MGMVNENVRKLNLVPYIADMVCRCHGSSTERRAEKHSNYENNEPHLGLGGALLKVPEQHVVFSQRYHTLPITHGLPQYTAGDMREDTDKYSHVHVFSER